MIAILKKELTGFFSSLMGYMSILVFLVLSWLFLWFFPDTSLLDYGYATLEPFFNIAPWILAFLVPAITMRLFSEEFQQGTIEFLFTKPIEDKDIILGKYFASLLVILFAISLTLVFFFSVYALGNPAGNIDTGASIGSYLGLFLLGAVYASIGLFTSSITKNQIIAFLLGMFLCLFMYDAIGRIAGFAQFLGSYDFIIESLGIETHYRSISKGVIDTRDLVYFISLIIGFLFLTGVSLRSKKWN